MLRANFYCNPGIKLGVSKKPFALFHSIPNTEIRLRWGTEGQHRLLYQSIHPAPVQSNKALFTATPPREDFVMMLLSTGLKFNSLFTSPAHNVTVVLTPQDTAKIKIQPW